MAFLLIVRLYFAYTRALIPFQIDYEEGNILNAGLRILHGQTPYPSPGSFPYVLNPYGPLGYLATALGIRLFGISLLGPRLLVLVSGASIALLIAALVRRLGGRIDIAWLFGGMFFCCPIVWRWLPLLRVDFWAVLMSLLGIYIFLAIPRFRYTSALIFAAAILVKPTALAAPLACGLELAIEKRTRELLSYLLLLGSVLGGCGLFLGPGFRFALIHTHPDPYSIERACKFYFTAMQGAVMPLAIFLLALFSGFRWNSNSRIIWLYSAGVCVTSLTSGKLGSETNHFLEWTAALCILSGLALSYLYESGSPVAKPLLMGTLALTGFLSVVPSQSVVESQDQRECPEAYEFMRSFNSDKLLSEDVTAIVLSGKPVLVSNPFVIAQIGERIQWLHGSLEEMVRRREFGLIVTGGEVQNFRPESGRWSATVMQRIREQYVLRRSFQCSPNFRAAYTPKPEGAADMLSRRFPGVGVK
jgi:hypothetical protein